VTEWTEGVLGDGAAILRDGQMVPITELLEILNATEQLREQLAAKDALLNYMSRQLVAKEQVLEHG
jgi:hypothetical protein